MNFYQMYSLLEELSRPIYVSYTGIVLDNDTGRNLIQRFSNDIPGNWKTIDDPHMTINMGEATKGPAAHLVGQQAEITIKSLGKSEKVIALGVDTSIPSENQQKHITLAVSPDGKAQDSNQITNWEPIPLIRLKGIIREVEKEGECPKIKDTRPPTPPAPNDPQEFARSLQGKPQHIVRLALKGKFPQLDDQDVEKLTKL
jgi:hypothetical protein